MGRLGNVQALVVNTERSGGQRAAQNFFSDLTGETFASAGSRSQVGELNVIIRGSTQTPGNPWTVEIVDNARAVYVKMRFYE
jgi:hypothetical protein